MGKISLIALTFALSSMVAFAGKDLDAVKKRGSVVCGTNTGLAGFSSPDSKGNWVGLDVDMCRAVAAAVLGNKDKVKFVPLSAQQRFTALQSGEIDILTRNTTRTLTRDTSLGLNFAPINFYDGQGFMVKTSLGVKSAKELNGATICVQPGTTTELNLSDWFRNQKMKFKQVVIEDKDETFKAFMTGRCDVYTTDSSGLVAEKSRLKDPNTVTILPELISKEPLGPAVRHGDDQFFDIVTWTFYAMLSAEELGITSANVDEMLKSKDPRIMRLLGVSEGNGKSLGLDEKWAYKVIKQVGNYGEVFERHVGKKSPLGLSRGLNDLWTRGGLMYAPPLR